MSSPFKPNSTQINKYCKQQEGCIYLYTTTGKNDLVFFFLASSRSWQLLMCVQRQTGKILGIQSLSSPLKNPRNFLSKISEIIFRRARILLRPAAPYCGCTDPARSASAQARLYAPYSSWVLPVCSETRSLFGSRSAQGPEKQRWWE